MRDRGVTRSLRGFTLVELVMAIALTAVVAVVVARFIATPVKGYMDVAQRAELVNAADTALARIGREVRLALPNSVRTSAAGTAVEVLLIRTGGRYRTEGGDPLDFSLGVDTFDVIGTLPDAADIVFDPAAIPGDCVLGATDCLVIYNTGQSGADAYAADNVAALTAAVATSLGFARTGGFPFASPQSRFYVVEGSLAYVCDLVAGTLRRHTGYPITADQSNVDSDAELLALGASAHLLADGLTDCDFAYQAGSATRDGLATLRIELSRGGEPVSLLTQIHVQNLP